MNKKRLILVFPLILLGILGYWWWSNNLNEKSTELVKIGVIMPLTGPVAEPGNNALKGIKLAIENYNLKNQKKIIIIVEDSKSDPKVGVSAMNKLVFNDKCKIIIGDIMSSVFLACAPIAEKNKVIFFSPGASAPAVREAGDYIFRNYLSDDFDGKAMASYILKEDSRKNIGIISVNNDYGVGINNVFEKEVNKLGGNLVFNEQYNQGSTDFITLISKVKGKNFDAIYMVCNPPEAPYLVKKIKEQGVKTQLYGNLSFENNEFINNAKGAFNEIVFSAPYFNLKDTINVTQTFNNAYHSTHNTEPDVAAALGYDVALIIIESLKKSSFKLEDLKDELYKTNFVGVTGRTTFDKEGDVVKSIMIKSINGTGEIKEVKVYEIND